jgi:hypothetical protein
MDFKNQNGLDWIALALDWGRLPGSSERGDELPLFVKFGEFLDQLRNH